MKIYINECTCTLYGWICMNRKWCFSVSGICVHRNDAANLLTAKTFQRNCAFGNASPHHTLNEEANDLNAIAYSLVGNSATICSELARENFETKTKNV